MMGMQTETCFVNADFQQLLVSRHGEATWKEGEWPPICAAEPDALWNGALEAGVQLRAREWPPLYGFGVCVFRDDAWRFFLNSEASKEELSGALIDLAAIYNFCITHGRYPDPGESRREVAA
jgi:hypothetical protein